MNIEFHENPSNGRPVISCGQRDGQTRRSYSQLFAILRMRLSKGWQYNVKVTYNNWGNLGTDGTTGPLGKRACDCGQCCTQQ